MTDLGQIAFNEWLKTPQIRPEISLDVFEIMPNHMHGIIIINEKNAHREEFDSHIVPGEYDSHIVPGEFDSPLRETLFRSPSNNIGAIVRGFKSTVTKQINLSDAVGFGWHRNYYEHIIRNEQSYQRISDYIVNNPKNWKGDKFYAKKSPSLNVNGHEFSILLLLR